MWHGARGNQVSPDPWEHDVEQVPMQPAPNSEWDDPPQYTEKSDVKKSVKHEKSVPLKNDPPVNSGKTEIIHVKQSPVPHEPEKEFVYRGRDKPPPPTRSSDTRSNKLHEWRPFLWERKRDMLMAGPSKPTKGLGYRLKNKWNSFKISWREFMYSMEVWRGSIKKIEGHQGMGVVSYFVFLRWLFFLNIFIFLLMFFVITFFQVTFEPETAYDKDLLGGGEFNYTSYVTTVAQCTSEYKPNVSSDALTCILDFFQGTGWMEETAMFYGYYTDKKVQLAASSYNLPLAYFLVAVVILLVSLIVMVRSTLSNFKDTVLSQESAKQANYCNNIFAGMDFNIDEDEAMSLKQKSVYNGLVAELDEQRHNLACESRTSSEKCKLYTIRFFINFLIFIMLGGAGAAIYYAQDFSAEITTDPNVENNYHSLVILVVEFLPSIVIGLLNGIYPFIFDILVKFEQYKPAFVIKISLIRMVFLKLASLCMIVASLYVQITCKDQDACLVGRSGCPAIQCWETYVGSAVYKLVVSDFIINFGVTVFVELPRKIITTRCDVAVFKKFGPLSFNIPKNVLGLVYSQTLIWLGFFFAPLLPAVSIFTFFCLFYLKKLSAMYNTVPPEKPYHASKSNSFFTVILMVAFFMICIPVGYALSNLNPSPMCGPFRLYDQPANIIDVQIQNSAEWFQTIWEICTSSAVVSSALILLCLAIYYLSELNSAHKDLVEMMKDQLVMEGKDKQFLLARINELSGGAPKKKPPPYQRSTMKTIDEKKQTKPSNNAQSNSNVVESNAPPPAAYNEPPPEVKPVTPIQDVDDYNGTEATPSNVNVHRRTPQETLDDW